ncbi:MAG: hypothetical protein K0U93_12145 [Gammaproteobacteria bacterium]|nr:hypothetical protein [Gammaproteobacteria bacterium]
MRVTLVLLKWTALLLCGVACVWFAANRFWDERPAAGREHFLSLSPFDVVAEQNLAIGILGLTAPPDVDVMMFGMKVAEASRLSAWSDSSLMESPGSLQPTVSARNIQCWLAPDVYQHDECLPFESAPEVIRSNAELIRRFREANLLDDYMHIGFLHNPAYLVVARLATADLLVHLRAGEYDVAYPKWRDQLRAARTMLRGPDDWIGKAYASITLAFTLQLLEEFLIAQPSIAKEHFAELSELLHPGGTADFNPEGLVRVGYANFLLGLQQPPPNPQSTRDWIHWLAVQFGQPERIRNRYYAFSREYERVPATRAGCIDGGIREAER